MIKSRYLFQKVQALWKRFPVVAILGVRQCGKTTLAKQVAGKNWKYIDLENPIHFEWISKDPMLFFQEYGSHVVIDEAQRWPPLFSVLKAVVDQKRFEKGRFLLTGSASFELIQQIRESLAGRVACVELSPFKMGEFLEEPMSDFFKIFQTRLKSSMLQDLKALSPTKTPSVVKKYFFLGGYPEPVLAEDPSFYLDWMEHYFKTYIERDLRAFYPKLDLMSYRRVLKMLTFLSSTIINRSDIARSVEVSEKTIRTYLDIIEGTYFWRSLEAFRSSKIKTTLKLPKGHFRDSGLAFFLQNVHSIEEMEAYPRLGNLFESFVIESCIRGIEAQMGVRNVRYLHFRTKAGGAIDFIVEGSFGLLPIEIKYASHTNPSQIPTLIRFVKHYKLPFALVLNQCLKPKFITQNILQVPVGCL